jgi:hypothetical protein
MRVSRRQGRRRPCCQHFYSRAELMGIATPHTILRGVCPVNIYVCRDISR